MAFFTNLTVLVTGASSGIGKSLTEQLAQQGAHVVIVARSTNQLQALAERLSRQYSVQITVISADLSQPNAAQAIYQQLQQQSLIIDVLINNAGFGKWTAFLQQPLTIYQQMLAVNMSAVVELTYLLLPAMLAHNRGGVINVASTGAFQPLPYIAVYGASKSFVLNFTEALAGEYANTAVHFLAFCPSNTDTNFTTVANADTSGMAALTADFVAEVALKAFEQKKNYYVTGRVNYLLAQLPRLLPRQWVVKLIANMFAKRVVSA